LYPLEWVRPIKPVPIRPMRSCFLFDMVNLSFAEGCELWAISFQQLAFGSQRSASAVIINLMISSFKFSQSHFSHFSRLSPLSSIPAIRALLSLLSSRLEYRSRFAGCASLNWGTYNHPNRYV